jgi:hypothetical protein
MTRRLVALASVAVAAGIAASLALAAAPSFTVYPSITQDGRYLNGDVGQWGDADTITWRWERCDSAGLIPCEAVPEVAGLVYRLTPKDFDKRIVLFVNAVGTGGQTSAAAKVDCLTRQSLAGNKQTCAVQP